MDAHLDGLGHVRVEAAGEGNGSGSGQGAGFGVAFFHHVLVVGTGAVATEEGQAANGCAAAPGGLIPLAALLLALRKKRI